MSVPVLKGTRNENLPSGVVAIAILLPRTVSEAFETGEPSSDRTVPVMIRLCAHAYMVQHSSIPIVKIDLCIQVCLNNFLGANSKFAVIVTFLGFFKSGYHS